MLLAPIWPLLFEILMIASITCNSILLKKYMIDKKRKTKLIKILNGCRIEAR